MLKEVEAGAKAKEACRRLGISERQTLYRWKGKNGRSRWHRRGDGEASR